MGTDSLKQVLIIPPDKRQFQEILARLQGESFNWTYLGQDPRPFYLARRYFQGTGTYLDLTDRFQQAARGLKTPYLTFLYQIGREVQSLRWWLSSLSYRSAYHSTTFQQASFVRVGLDLVSDIKGPRSMVIVVPNSVVRTTLQSNVPPEIRPSVIFMGMPKTSRFRWFKDATQMLAHRSFFLFREGLRVIAARRNVSRVSPLKESTNLLFSRFNPGNRGRGTAFHTSFFGNLSDKAKDSGCSITLVPMISHSIGYRDALMELQEASPQMLIPHRYLGFTDLLRAAWASAGKAPLPRNISRLSGMDITPLVKNELRADWISNQAADSYLFAQLMKKLASLQLKVSRAFYIYENQPWERALCWQIRRSFPDTKLIGYQYGRVPELLLNWRLAPGGENEAPLPHKVVTGGAYATRQIANEYEPGCVQTGGALEMQDFLREMGANDTVMTADSPVSILVAPSIGLEEAAELVDTAGRLFDEDAGVRMVIKCHPLMPFSKVRGSIDGPLPSHVEVSETSPIDLMKQSSVMLYTSSTICVQALALGLPTIHVRTKFELDMDPLENTPEVRLEACGPKQLRERILWLLAHREEFVSMHREQWEQVVNDIYGPTDNHTIRAFLD